LGRGDGGRPCHACWNTTSAERFDGLSTPHGPRLARAERELDRADRGQDPQWIGYFDGAYLSAKFGHCFAALERGDLAQRFAAKSLEMDSRYVRGRQFNLALLATAYVQAGDVEQAATVGIEAVKVADSPTPSDSMHDASDQVKRRQQRGPNRGHRGHGPSVDLSWSVHVQYVGSDDPPSQFSQCLRCNHGDQGPAEVFGEVSERPVCDHA
jgi:hypothetical protein